MRWAGEKGIGGGRGFAAFVGFCKEERDLVLVARGFEYGLELVAFALDFFFALAIAGLRVIENLRRGRRRVVLTRCQAAKPCGEE